MFKLQRNIKKAVVAAKNIAIILNQTVYIYNIEGDNCLVMNNKANGEHLTIKP